MLDVQHQASLPKIQLAVLWAMFFMFVNLSNESIIQLLTPTIAEEFEMTKAKASLIVTVAGILSGVGGTIYATLTDFFSMRQLHLFGVAAFSAGSVLAFAVQDSFPALVAARMLQCAGAVCAQGCFVVLVTRYMNARDRSRYLAFSSALFMFGSGLGAFLGAVISSAMNWSYALLFPVATLLAVPSFWKHLPRERRSGARLDWVGALLVTVGVSAAILSISLRNVYGLAVTVLMVGLYLAHERGRRHPFLDLSLLRIRGFKPALLCAMIILGTQSGVLFLLPFIARDVYGLSLFETGLLFMSAYLPALATGIVSGRTLNRLGQYRTFTLGWTLLFASLIALVLTMGAPLILTGLALYLFAISNPFLYTGIVAALTGRLPPDKLGSGMGVFQLMAGGGNALVVSVVGILLTYRLFDSASLRIGNGMPINEYGQLLLLLSAFSLIGWLLFSRVFGRTIKNG